ncbi:hypothetical protein A8W25_31090 [Streptomyces sp. ERV7]|uniref:hypothetical protein n=1 Tax=Streptomyces sp. ERV7 TaxID=1322334 RepID=UPI0007F34F22|nr:hypothetical protein [Streptomyces sp. ERV7]OAR26729.1 hypothetical protein A8W25_31090 [Streptomyces sp. ERV7]
MSRSVGIHTFVNGEPGQADLDVMREVLAPYDAAPENTTASTRDFLIRAADGGEAEVFVDDAVIAVERPQAGEVLGIIAKLADRLRGVIEPGNGTLLCREDSRAHLPEGLEDSCVFTPTITREALEAAMARSMR